MIEMDLHKKLKSEGGSMLLQLKVRIEAGSFVTLYGPSGAGKTSTLRILAGLLKPDQGLIKVGGNSWFDSARNLNLPPQKRRLGFVFQDYALFPHMSVRHNLQFAAGQNKNLQLIDELIHLMELESFLEQKPDTLSGGQQQRTALARALAAKPDILLLDEPLAALDYKIRLKLQDYLLKIHQEYHLTTLMVSHDLGEIHKLSDRVLVLENGELVRSGSPDEIFVNRNISGKFKFVGEVLSIESQDVIYVVSVLVQNQVVKVVAEHSDMEGIAVGDKVLLASKAFNPVIYKIDQL